MKYLIITHTPFKCIPSTTTTFHIKLYPLIDAPYAKISIWNAGPHNHERQYQVQPVSPGWIQPNAGGGLVGRSNIVQKPLLHNPWQPLLISTPSNTIYEYCGHQYIISLVPFGRGPLSGPKYLDLIRSPITVVVVSLWSCVRSSTVQHWSRNTWVV